MDKKIMCSISLGALTQKILLPDNTVINSTLVDLPENLFKEIKENKVYNVHLFGPNDYIEGLIDIIEEKEFITFQKNKIKFEVN